MEWRYTKVCCMYVCMYVRESQASRWRAEPVLDHFPSRKKKEKKKKKKKKNTSNGRREGVYLLLQNG